MRPDQNRAWIETVEPKDAEDLLAEIYSDVSDPQSGAVDSIMAVHSLHPRGMRAHFELYKAVMRGTRELSGGDREMIALTVSKINACDY